MPLSDPPSPPRYSIPHILGLSSSSVAAQLAYSLSLTLLDPLMSDMHLSAVHVNLVWSIGPIVGFFTQPIVAFYSDRSRGRFGRRSPFIVVGSLLSAFLNVVLFVIYHFRKTGPHTVLLVAIYVTVAGAFLTENMFDVASRSLVLDLMPPEQEQMGSTLVCAASGISGVITNLVGGIGYFVDDPGYQSRVPPYIFIIGSALMIIALPITLCCAKEKPYTGHASDDDTNIFIQMFQALKEMPRIGLHASVIQLFSNLAFYPAQMKTTSLFKSEVFPDTDEGLCFGMLFLAIVGGVNLVYGLLHVYIVKGIGAKKPYVIGHAALALCCVGLFFTLNRWAVAALMIPIWISTMTLLSVPYAVVACCVPEEKMGLHVGLMNCCVCIGEQAAVGMDAATAKLAKSLPKKWNIRENRANIGAGALPAIVGFILALLITIPNENTVPSQMNTQALVSEVDETPDFTS